MASIKIIDDDVEMAENLSIILKKEGYSVTILDHTEGALEELINNTPDLLILDVMFPENHAAGFDLAREVRQIEEIKKLPIILLTSINQEFPMGFSANDIDPDWMPVQDFVEKPIDMQQLLRKVGSLIEASKR